MLKNRKLETRIIRANVRLVDRKTELDVLELALGVVCMAAILALAVFA